MAAVSQSLAIGERARIRDPRLYRWHSRTAMLERIAGPMSRFRDTDDSNVGSF
jgi:hypothetical protein